MYILKKTLLLVSILSYMTSSAYLNPISLIKNGTKIIYDVSNDGAQYLLTITVTKIGNGFSFDWYTSKPLNKKGSVNILKNATENTNAIFNFFEVEKAELINQTSILISNKMFENWKNNSSMEIFLDESKNIKSIFGNGYNHTQNFEYKNNNSNELDCRTVSDKDGYSITYLNDATFPIIVEMHLDWSIKLSKIIE